MSRDERLEPDVTAALADASSAVISDVLDRLGRRDQVLDPAIRPLWPEARLIGWRSRSSSWRTARSRNSRTRAS